MDLEIPRDKLVVITGLSGSGKSSLAFDTNLRRRAAPLRRVSFFLCATVPRLDGEAGCGSDRRSQPGHFDRPEGRWAQSPLDGRHRYRGLHDYLRLLFARVGQPHCPECGDPITQQTPQQIVNSILEMEEGARLLILAPIIKDRKGEHKGVFDDLQSQGYVRVRVNGDLFEIGDAPELDRYKMHTIEAVIDRIIVRAERADPDDPGIVLPGTDRTRLTDSGRDGAQVGRGLSDRFGSEAGAG